MVTRIGNVRKNIVTWRALWLYGRIDLEEPLSIHVADLLKIFISTTVGMRKSHRNGPLSEETSSEELETGNKDSVLTALKSQNSKYHSMNDTVALLELRH